MRAHLIFLLLTAVLTSSCSYRWGFRERSIPGGYKQVSIPIFKNRTGEVGLETAFTNALILQFERSQVAQVTKDAISPVRIEGEITKINLAGSGGIQGGPNVNIPLPVDATIWTEYTVTVEFKIYVRRASDQKVLWTSAFTEQTNYQAPQIAEPIVNSADSTYNDSARRKALGDLASDAMSEAHDRITENF